MVQCPAATLLCIALEKRIPAPRESKSWTQVEMAVYLGISRNHLSGLERGKREIGLLMLQVIAKGLDTTMDKLLKGL
jgi:transcriptional regulator with XRE-family HTH domain